MSSERSPHAPVENLHLGWDEYFNVSPLLTKALNQATEIHEGQFRQSGEPYVTHCIAVAKIIYEEWGIEDENMLAAALLHDGPEDTSLTVEDISLEFNQDVANMVEGVSKFRSQTGNGTDHETIKKVLDKSLVDPRVAVLKLADRLHNMRTLDAMPPNKQKSKAEETFIYTQLADSLGMWVVKRELGDLAFKYADPEGYRKIKKEIDSDPRRSELFVGFIKTKFEELVRESGSKADVEIKFNGYWAMKTKRERYALLGKSYPDTFSSIDDVTSVFVTFENTTDCYCFLGIVHQAFSTILSPERFDEYLVLPTVNNFSALQTTLNFPQGALKVAMTTKEKDEFNKWGVVSLLKKGKKDLSEYTLKLVFTPSGVCFLKKEATGVDLAVNLDPIRGTRAVGAVVDGEEKPLSVVIPNASDVEINWGNGGSTVDPDHLDYATLNSTRKVINEALIREKRAELIARGKVVMEQILTPRGLLELRDIPRHKDEDTRGLVGRLFPTLTEPTLDTIYLLLGGNYLDREFVEQELNRAGITKELLNLSTILVSGEDRKGVLADLSEWISKKGLNIHLVNHQKREKAYSLRFVVEDLGQIDREELHQKLSQDEKFTHWLIV